jgi:hypothetical protein
VTILAKILLLQNYMIQKNRHAIWEFTAPKTPQQNCLVERKFATIYIKIRAVLNAAGFTPWLRTQLWARAAHFLTDLENLLCNDKSSCPYQILNQKPRWIHHMHTFGEMDIVYDNQKIKSKLRNKGFSCIFVGYSNIHAEKVYKFYNYETKKIFLSRNVVWLNKMYSGWKNMKSPPTPSSDLPDDFLNVTDLLPTPAPPTPPYGIVDEPINVDQDEDI